VGYLVLVRVPPAAQGQRRQPSAQVSTCAVASKAPTSLPAPRTQAPIGPIVPVPYTIYDPPEGVRKTVFVSVAARVPPAALWLVVWLVRTASLTLPA
jgi:hypothetical protein